jgi:outer membrane immunogenic protein
VKRLSLCLIALALVAPGPAKAADFKGFYFGANVGAAYGSSDANTFTVFSPTGYFATTSPGAIAIAGTEHLAPTRFTGGAQGGVNLQHNNWVFGVEAEMGSMHLNDSATKSGTYPCCAPTGFTVTQSISTGWLFTLRPRVGFTHGPWLLYGTGGLAVTDLTYQSLFTDTFATAHELGGVSNDQRGWVAGGGIEFKTAPHWSLKGEFLRANFGSVKQVGTDLTAFTPLIPFPTNPFTHTADLSVNLVRFGFNYHF